MAFHGIRYFLMVTATASIASAVGLSWPSCSEAALGAQVVEPEAAVAVSPLQKAPHLRGAQRKGREGQGRALKGRGSSAGEALGSKEAAPRIGGKRWRNFSERNSAVHGISWNQYVSDMYHLFNQFQSYMCVTVCQLYC